MNHQRSVRYNAGWGRIALLALSVGLAASCGSPTTTETSSKESDPAHLAAENERLQPLPFTSLAGAALRVPLEDAPAATVVLFVRTDCPISNRYAPELSRLAQEFNGQGVRFITAYVDPNVDASALSEHFASYALPGVPVADSRHELVRHLAATVTPEAVVVAPNGEVRYRGRIDNRYVTFGQARPEATERDLHRVLTAVAQGKPLAFAQTEAVGCFIADLDGAL